MHITFNQMLVFLFSFMLFVSMSSATAAPLAGNTMSDSVSGIEFVWVPKGCFFPANIHKTEPVLVKKKAPNKQLIAFDVLDDEASTSPQAVLGETQAVLGEAQTCLNKGFWMGKFEITQAQYHRFINKNPASFKNGDNFPVESVRWLEARTFIRKLNAASGKTFRLPSETEWEYAATFGAESQHGSDNIDDVAWYLGNSDGSTHAVGQKNANALGLFDMRGNVWEWTQDCWNEDIQAAPKDGSAWLEGQCGARVLRGGSWYDDKSMLSSKARVYNDTDSADNNSGFRIVLDESK